MSYFKFLDGITISDTAKNLIKKMLSPEKKRPSAEEVLSHNFITETRSSEKPNIVLPQELDSLQNNMRSYINSSSMRRLILTSVANRLSYEDIEKLHDIFIEIDTNNDGCISYDEFKNGFQIMIDKDRNLQVILNDLFNSIEKDRTKKINYSEFIAAAMDKKFYEDQNKLIEIFDSLDTNKNGKITINEFERILNLENSKKKNDYSYESFIKEFEKYDVNKDGEIDYNEFVGIVTKKKDEYLPKKPNRGYKVIINKKNIKIFHFSFFYILIYYLRCCGNCKVF